MKKNIGTKDRVIRLLIAIILFLLALWFHSLIILLFSLFAAYEALAGWCIMYQLLGKNSCKIKK